MGVRERQLKGWVARHAHSIGQDAQVFADDDYFELQDEGAQQHYEIIERDKAKQGWKTPLSDCLLFFPVLNGE